MNEICLRLVNNLGATEDYLPWNSHLGCIETPASEYLKFQEI